MKDLWLSGLGYMVAVLSRDVTSVSLSWFYETWTTKMITDYRCIRHKLVATVATIA